jgi:hypothetical protein
LENCSLPRGSRFTTHSKRVYDLQGLLWHRSAQLPPIQTTFHVCKSTPGAAYRSSFSLGRVGGGGRLIIIITTILSNPPPLYLTTWPTSLLRSIAPNRSRTMMIFCSWTTGGLCTSTEISVQGPLSGKAVSSYYLPRAVTANLLHC